MEGGCTTHLATYFMYEAKGLEMELPLILCLKLLPLVYTVMFKIIFATFVIHLPDCIACNAHFFTFTSCFCTLSCRGLDFPKLMKPCNHFPKMLLMVKETWLLNPGTGQNEGYYSSRLLICLVL